MKTKYIEKMRKWNATDLTKEQKQRGIKRLQKFDKEDGMDLWVTLTNLRNGSWHCRAIYWYGRRWGFIARTGKSEREAKAKVGLAVPLKSWGLG